MFYITPEQNNHEQNTTYFIAIIFFKANPQFPFKKNVIFYQYNSIGPKLRTNLAHSDITKLDGRCLRPQPVLPRLANQRWRIGLAKDLPVRELLETLHIEKILTICAKLFGREFTQFFADAAQLLGI